MNAVNPLDVPVSLIGHPFAPIGKGEDMRCYYRGLKAVGIRPHVVNVYEGKPQDRELEREFADDLRRTSAGGIDIFCLNGDEVEPVLSHLGSRRAPADFSVVVPFWELSKYPPSGHVSSSDSTRYGWRPLSSGTRLRMNSIAR